MDRIEEVSVVGAGAWGTTLAWLLADKGLRVRLWVREPELADVMREQRRNTTFMPDLVLPELVLPSNDLAAVLSCARLVLVVVPSHGLREVARAAAPVFPADAVVVSATKGLERGSEMRMTEVLAQELGSSHCGSIAALSGPNLSSEIAQGMPAVSVVASAEEATARFVQEVLSSSLFRVYSNCDIIGVELCGALKNVVAIAAGACDGLGFGDNAKAALLTRGLAEMGRLGVPLGARASTFWGAAGLGDLAATCMSRLSRNWSVGWRLAQGETLEQIQRSRDSVAEGIYTTTAAYELAARLGVEVPITAAVRAVLFEGSSPAEVARLLMTRQSRMETEEWHGA
jgi:glycerol-3-phosphate dehydrogenase (NAD(P)+)